MQAKTSGLYGVAIRITTLASKFVGIILFAKFLSVEDYASYGVLYFLLMYAVYFISFSFYSFSTRSVLLNEIDISSAILTQFVLIGSLLVLLGIALASAPEMLREYYPYAFIVFAILVFEQVSHEIYHYLIISDKVEFGGLAFFVRVGLWPLVGSFLMWGFPEFRTLDFVLLLWLFGAGLSAVVSLIFIWPNLCTVPKIRFHWLFKGLAVALPLFLSSLLIRGMLSLDKVWLASVSVAGSTAAYVLFFNLANSLVSILEAGVFSKRYPKLIMFVADGDFAAYRVAFRQFLMVVIVASVAFSILFVVFLDPLLAFVGKEAFLIYKEYTWFILLSVVFFAVGMVWQYGLFAVKEDLAIFYSHTIGGAIFISGWLFFPDLGGLQVLISLSLSLLAVIFAKAYLHSRVIERI